MKVIKRLSILTLLMFAVGICGLNAQKPAKHAVKQTQPQAQPTYNIYPDEYTELDDTPSPTVSNDAIVLKILEKARQQYLQAMVYIKKGDTVSAAKYFEQSIDILNRLVSYPGIENNNEFTDLAQSIIEDYESFVQSIDELDENSSLFVIRDKLFQEIEDQSGKTPQISSIQIPKDSTKKGITPIQLATTIQMDDNEFVQKNVTFLSSPRGKKFFRQWLERSTKWFPMMKKIAKEEEVPEEIIYLSMIESGLKPTAVSRAQAVGLWQFIRSTGELYNLNKNSSVWIDERRDPEKATHAAMRHLRDLFMELGDWHLALAAYNCGVNCVNRAIAKYGQENPTFWDVRQYLPKETRNYVPLYIAATKMAMQPEAYDIPVNDLKYHEEYKYEIQPIKEPVNLASLAKCAGITEEELQSLNPELIRSCTPPDVEEYLLKLPVGSLQKFKVNLGALTDDEKMPWLYHKVKKGETLVKIAQKYNISKEEIASVNDISAKKNKLAAGISLRIPVTKQNMPTEDLASNQTTGQNTRTNTNEASPSNDTKTDGSDAGNSTENETAATKTAKSDKTTDEVPVVQVKHTRNVNGKKVTHTVQKGETLYQIAQIYGVRLADLRNLNNLSYDEDNIQAGTELVIANDASNSLADNKISKIEKPRIIKHKVKRGETLAQIADNYNVSIESIRDLNRLRKSKLTAGQTLKVSTNTKNIEPEHNLAAKTSRDKITHKVKSGETISTIAAKYGVTEDQIKQWNESKIDGNKILSGSKLKIYDPTTSKGSSQASSKKVKKAPNYYTIRKGDNLGEISQKFGVSIGQLKKKNKSLDEHKLLPGKKIRIQ